MFSASGALLSILHLHHELMPKVRKKHQLTLGVGEGRQKSLEVFIVPLPKGQRRHQLTDLGHISKGQVVLGTG